MKTPGHGRGARSTALARAVGVAAVALMVVAGEVSAATYPPDLSRHSGPPGTVVRLGPAPGSGHPTGVPRANDCAQPAAFIIRRTTDDRPADPASGRSLTGRFGRTGAGWLTLVFRVPAVPPGRYDVAVTCGAVLAATTADADGPPFTVLAGVPATSTVDVSATRPAGSATTIVLLAVGAVGFLLTMTLARRRGPTRRGIA